MNLFPLKFSQIVTVKYDQMRGLDEGDRPDAQNIRMDLQDVEDEKNEYTLVNKYGTV